MKIERLFNLENKFKRYSGWAGADGIYSFIYQNNILMYFSDTFIGNSTKDDKRVNYKLINNSLAIADASLNNIDFIYNKKPISSVFLPEKGYFWLEDGIIVDDNLYIFALHMENDIFSKEIFKILSTKLIKLQLPFNKRINYEICDFNFDKSNIILGSSIIYYDNYYYIFGYINDYQNKKIILSRSKSMVNIDLEFLNDDKSFKKDINNLLILREHFAAEFKFVLINNLFYCAYTYDSLSKDIHLLIVDDLFSKYENDYYIYTCPEFKNSIITYNAKIQQAMSNDKTLVISYNVNTLDNKQHSNLDIYRPRFIKINISEVINEKH